MRHLLITPGLIINHDWPIPAFPVQFETRLQYAGYGWLDDVLGRSAVFGRGGTGLAMILTSLPVYLGLSGYVLSKAFLFFVLFISPVCMYVFSRKFIEERRIRFVLGFVYVLSPWVFDRVVAGDIYALVAYCVLPMLVWADLRAIETGWKMFYPLIALVFFTLDDVNSFLLLSFISLLSLLYALLNRKETLLWKWVTIHGLAFVIFLAMNPTAWYEPVFGGQFGFTGKTIASIYLFPLSRYSTLLNTLRLTGNVMNWFMSSPRPFPTVWEIAGILYVVMVFAGALVDIRNKRTVALCALAVLAVFLGKGTNPPLGSLFVFGYYNVPYFILLHEPNKIILWASFAYVILFGTFLAVVQRRLTSVLDKCVSNLTPARYKNLLCDGGRGVKVAKARGAKVAKAFVLILLCIPVVVFSSPFLSGDFGGNLRAVDFPQGYEDVNRWLSTQNDFFYVLWLPPDTYTQYEWLGTNPYQQHDIMAQYSPKPAFRVEEAIPPSAPSLFTYYVISSLYADDARFLPHVLGRIGVKYLIYRHHAQNWHWRNLSPRFAVDLEARLHHLDGLRLVRTFGDIDVYQNAYFRDHGFIVGTSTVALVGGGRSIFSLDENDTHLINESTLVFAGQVSDETIREIYNNIDELILTENNFRDISFALLPAHSIYQAGLFTSEGDPEREWSRLFANFWWYRHDFLDTVGESAITTADGQTMKIPFTLTQNDQYELWLRLLTGDAAVNEKAISDLTISIDNNQSTRLNPRSRDPSSYRWMKIGVVPMHQGAHELEIRNEYGFSIIDQIVIAPTAQIARALKDYQSLLDHSRYSVIYDLRHAEERLIEIPKQSRYRVFIQLDANSTADASIRVAFIASNQTVSREAFANHASTIGFEAVDLNTGTYRLSLVPSYAAKLILIEEPSDDGLERGHNDTVELDYVRMNPVSYKISMRTGGEYAFVTVFHSFDQDWRLDADVLEHFTCFSFADCYFARGHGSMSLEYYGQKTFYAMYVITLGGLMMSLALCVGPFVGRRLKHRASGRVSAVAKLTR